MALPHAVVLWLVWSALMGVGRFIYDFQTLLTGGLAIAVAIFAGIPVWRQLKDSNLQTRISHRETLANLLRDVLRRYTRVDEAIRKPLQQAIQATIDPIGEPIELDTEDAFHLAGQLNGVLDWYLVVLADTEHRDIEDRKAALKASLDELVKTLDEAHWADHNDQDQGEDGQISDAEWEKIVAQCAAAKIEASQRVSEANSAYRELRLAQEAWIQSLRAQIAKLDLQIASPR
jgi:hypothetical protein